jgi:putative transcriptional regulator
MTKATKTIKTIEPTVFSEDLEIQAFCDGLLESAQQMKRGQTNIVYSPVVQARTQSGLSQSQFAKLLGVSVRTFQEWEQGRRQPTGAAKTLIAIAQRNPEALRAVAV